MSNGREVAVPAALDAAVNMRDPDNPHTPSAMERWAVDAREAFLVAQSLSESSFVPASLRNRPNDVAMAIIAGNEMGLTPLAALRSIDVIQGTPALRAHTMRALLQSQGHSIQVVEADDEHVVMRGKRKGESEWQVVTWDIPRATLMGLAGKAEWRRQPRTMMIARATSELARLIAADALLAMPYAFEEISDEPAQGNLTAADVAGQGRPPGWGPESPHDVNGTAQQAAVKAAVGGDAPEVRSPSPQMMTKIKLLAKDLGMTDTKVGGEHRDEYLAALSAIACRDVTSQKDLTWTEARWVIDAWSAKVASMPSPPPRSDIEQDVHDGLDRQAQDEPDERASLLSRIYGGANARGISTVAVTRALEDKFAQPPDDLTVEQLQEFLTAAALGKVTFAEPEPEDGP